MRPFLVKSAVALVLCSSMSATAVETGSKESVASHAVTIAGQRYVRAAIGVSVEGGGIGSRIILDGNLYLLDEGNLDSSLVYQEPDSGSDSGSGNVILAPQIAAAQASNHESVRQLPEFRAAEKQRRQDFQATTLLLVAQRERLWGEEQGDSQVIDVEKLKLDKIRLEQASANDARLVLEAKAAEIKAAELRIATAEAAELEVAELDASVVEQPETVVPVVSLEEPETAHSQGDSTLLAGSDKSDQGVTTRATSKQAADAELAELPAIAAATPVTETIYRRPPSLIDDSRKFKYLEALPVSYDVGGNGVMLEGSGSVASRIMFFGRLGITDEYREVLLGAGYYLTPTRAARVTLALLTGIEYGQFELVDRQTPGVKVDFSDSGLYLAAVSRWMLSRRFEINAGIAYSSIFEGDASLFGGSNYHLNRKLDLLTRFELGDNDLLGIGLRYYY